MLNGIVTTIMFPPKLSRLSFFDTKYGIYLVMKIFPSNNKIIYLGNLSHVEPGREVEYQGLGSPQG